MIIKIYRSILLPTAVTKKHARSNLSRGFEMTTDRLPFLPTQYLLVQLWCKSDTKRWKIRTWWQFNPYILDTIDAEPPYIRYRTYVLQLRICRLRPRASPGALTNQQVSFFEILRFKRKTRRSMVRIHYLILEICNVTFAHSRSPFLASLLNLKLE